MSPALSARLLTPTMVDPWLDLYMPAALAEGGLFEGAVELIRLLPADQRGDAWAIAARGRFVLGRDGDAWRAFEQAQSHGGSELEALATFLLGGGVKRAAQRAAGATSAGLAADACCDAAVLAMGAADVSVAQAAIAQALAALPAHRESLHWQRFLAEPDSLRAWTRSRARADGAPATRAMVDALYLAPRRETGWVSPRRLAERCYVQGNASLAPPGSALAYLYDVGRTSCLLGTEPDWAAVPRAHPLVDAELQLGQVEDLVDEERPAATLAGLAWQAALESDDAARISDVGQALCALATRAGELAPVGHAAAENLCAAGGQGNTLYLAYAALLAAHQGHPEAHGKAAAILAMPAPGALAFRMAIATLRMLKKPSEARRALATRTHDPVLGSTARALADESVSPLGQGIVCSPRLIPRGLRMGQATRR